jgi:hypothetical protein
MPRCLCYDKRSVLGRNTIPNDTWRPFRTARVERYSPDTWSNGEFEWREGHGMDGDEGP